MSEKMSVGENSSAHCSTQSINTMALLILLIGPDFEGFMVKWSKAISKSAPYSRTRILENKPFFARMEEASYMDLVKGITVLLISVDNGLYTITRAIHPHEEKWLANVNNLVALFPTRSLIKWTDRPSQMPTFSESVLMKSTSNN